ncbi:hypothetical protein PT277_10280 [Acetobacteraceae bacterium ESL0709]|nr:hypothetical protein [Acetobacteraceae bacterium ESL0697]MDF7679068.1 hypothetical protein [Acetobacteraceae bacterium ESL0709]
MSLKKFRISHTEQTSVDADRIWLLWSDVNNWPIWDEGLEMSSLEGEFKEGDTFLLKPQGADNPIRAQFTNVTKNRGFTDVTKLPFGELRAIHTFEIGSHGNLLTHTIEADVAEDYLDFFTNVIWAGMEIGLPQSVRNLVSLAEKQI